MRHLWWGEALRASLTAVRLLSGIDDSGCAVAGLLGELRPTKELGLKARVQMSISVYE